MSEARSSARSAVATQRPAETVTAAAAAGLILARVLELDDPTVITALGAVIGLLPAAVTWLVETARRTGRLPPPSDVPAPLTAAYAEVGKAAADLLQDSREISDLDKRGALIKQVADLIKGMRAPG